MARAEDTETGTALGEILSERGLSQNSLAKRTGLSQPYVNQIATGKRRPSADWIELVASVLDLSDAERERLHRAAAKDHGFKIDLTRR